MTAPAPALGPAWPTRPPSGGPGNPHSGSQLRGDLSADLATMARQSGLDTLGYLLEMVRLEAENVTRHKQNGGR